MELFSEKSPLAEGRGLKWYIVVLRGLTPLVAPRRGAWIEIISLSRAMIALTSPLAEGRGLKSTGLIISRMRDSSPLAEGRGLKLRRSRKDCGKVWVAPRRGAWIEIYCLPEALDEFKVAPRRGAWIEMADSEIVNGGSVVAPRRGAWIEIFYLSDYPIPDRVAPRRGAWIEILPASHIPHR